MRLKNQNIQCVLITDGNAHPIDVIGYEVQHSSHGASAIDIHGYLTTGDYFPSIRENMTLEEALEDALLAKDAMELAQKLRDIREQNKPRSNNERKALRRQLIEFMRGWSRE